PLLPWQALEVPAGMAIPEILVGAPQPGFYRLVVDGPAVAAVLWRDDGTDGDVTGDAAGGASDATGASQAVWRELPGLYLVTHQRARVRVVPEDPAHGPWRLTLQLVADPLTDPPGPYPRQPPL